MKADEETLRKALRYVRAQYKLLREDDDSHESFAATEAINLAGKRFEIGHGAEGFSFDGGREGITYLNMGDTYDGTLVFDSREERFEISTYGDKIEQLEAQGIALD